MALRIEKEALDSTGTKSDRTKLIEKMLNDEIEISFDECLNDDKILQRENKKLNILTNFHLNKRNKQFQNMIGKNKEGIKRLKNEILLNRQESIDLQEMLDNIPDEEVNLEIDAEDEKEATNPSSITSLNDLENGDLENDILTSYQSAIQFDKTIELEERERERDITTETIENIMTSNDISISNIEFDDEQNQTLMIQFKERVLSDHNEKKQPKSPKASQKEEREDNARQKQRRRKTRKTTREELKGRKSEKVEERKISVIEVEDSPTKRTPKETKERKKPKRGKKRSNYRKQLEEFLRREKKGKLDMK